MNVKDLIQRAGGLISTSRLERQLAEAEQALTQEPRNARHWLRAGQISERLSDKVAAVVSYRTAALLLCDQHEYSQSAAVLRLALKLSPADGMLHSELARVDRLKPSTLSEFYARAITERTNARRTSTGETQIAELKTLVVPNFKPT